MGAVRACFEVVTEDEVELLRNGAPASVLRDVSLRRTAGGVQKTEPVERVPAGITRLVFTVTDSCSLLMSAVVRWHPQLGMCAHAGTGSRR
jgi:hypothetical protein